jgi:hypothetical protein
MKCTEQRKEIFPGRESVQFVFLTLLCYKTMYYRHVFTYNMR